MQAERTTKNATYSHIYLYGKEIISSSQLRRESSARLDCESYAEEIVSSTVEEEQVGPTRVGRTDPPSHIRREP